MVQKFAGSIYLMTGKELIEGAGTALSGGLIELLDDFNTPTGNFLVTNATGIPPVFIPRVQIEIKNNFEAVLAPTKNDDVTAGFSPGSVWIDTRLNEGYLCSKATPGAARWSKTTVDSISELGQLSNALDNRIQKTDLVQTFNRAVPEFSSATTTTPVGTYQVTASSQRTTSQQGWRSVQATANMNNREWVTDNRLRNLWINMRFPKPVVINQLRLQGRVSSGGLMESGWRLEASNNLINWRLLHTGTRDVPRTLQIVNFENTIPFTNYRTVFPTATRSNAGLSAYWLYKDHYSFKISEV